MVWKCKYVTFPKMYFHMHTANYVINNDSLVSMIVKFWRVQLANFDFEMANFDF